ncbi:hypothetical protein ACET1Q_23155 [Escherichia coli]|uniref:hypothetical protein n=1 Tax=Escherichia coli TaxID=562 RepID=UPI0035A69C22
MHYKPHDLLELGWLDSDGLAIGVCTKFKSFLAAHQQAIVKNKLTAQGYPKVKLVFLQLMEKEFVIARKT